MSTCFNETSTITIHLCLEIYFEQNPFSFIHSEILIQCVLDFVLENVTVAFIEQNDQHDI